MLMKSSTLNYTNIKGDNNSDADLLMRNLSINTIPSYNKLRKINSKAYSESKTPHKTHKGTPKHYILNLTQPSSKIRTLRPLHISLKTIKLYLCQKLYKNYRKYMLEPYEM
ncbi:hypothetical protein DMUE_1785 [Dictyocoela muelleri]|nr:hypothetical protein DMUE_1785 [Dictyocoela muelleri]